jgi:hypothetical protein
VFIILVKPSRGRVSFAYISQDKTIIHPESDKDNAGQSITKKKNPMPKVLIKFRISIGAVLLWLSRQNKICLLHDHHRHKCLIDSSPQILLLLKK